MFQVAVCQRENRAILWILIACCQNFVHIDNG